MSLQLTVFINGVTWGMSQNWGDTLPPPVLGEPYTLITDVDEDEEFKKHPQAHPSYCFVSASGIRTLPVEEIVIAQHRRVVFRAGQSRFVFQLAEDIASRELNVDQILGRLVRQ